MAHLLWIILISDIFFAAHGTILQSPQKNIIAMNEIATMDPGDPLFLTQYIENGNIEEGRRLADVPLTKNLDIQSYAGYFTINTTYDSNQFFWYFPAMNRDKAHAPVVVWLQGGPGGSSLFGLLKENGPLKERNGKFKRRKLNWALSHHMIYIDNPVGTGFSFTNDSRGYCTDETQVGEQLYSTLMQFFQMFPELQPNKFFITGESYAGKYAPALAYAIHKHNPTAKVKINLKGIAIGNGLSDPIHQLDYGKYLNQIGLIDENQAKVYEEDKNKIIGLIKQQKWDDAFDIYYTLDSFFANMTGFNYFYNYLHAKVNTEIKDFATILQKPEVRKAIHVGNKTFNDGLVVALNLKQDLMKSVTPWISELLDYYPMLIYSGQLDIIVAYPLTVNYLKNLNFTGADEYKTAKRQVWKVDGEVAGYVKQAGRLVEVMVRNAGHMVPRDQPKWALDMITRFTHEKAFVDKRKRI